MVNVKSMEEIKNENGVYALQLLFYAMGVRDNYKKAMYTEIISSREALKNSKVLYIKGNKYLNEDIIDESKKYILEIIDDMRKKDELF